MPRVWTTKNGSIMQVSKIYPLDAVFDEPKERTARVRWSVPLSMGGSLIATGRRCAGRAGVRSQAQGLRRCQGCRPSLVALVEFWGVAKNHCARFEEPHPVDRLEEPKHS